MSEMPAGPEPIDNMSTISDPQLDEQDAFTRDLDQAGRQHDWWVKLMGDRFTVDLPARGTGYETNTRFDPYDLTAVAAIDVIHRGGSLRLSKNAVGEHGNTVDDNVALINPNLNLLRFGSFMFQHDAGSSIPKSLYLELAKDIELGLPALSLLVSPEPNAFKHSVLLKYTDLEPSIFVAACMSSFLNRSKLSRETMSPDKPNEAAYRQLSEVRDEAGNSINIPLGPEQYAGLVIRGLQERVDGMTDAQLEEFNFALGLVGEGKRPYVKSPKQDEEF